MRWLITITKRYEKQGLLSAFYRVWFCMAQSQNVKKTKVKKYTGRGSNAEIFRMLEEKRIPMKIIAKRKTN